MKKKVSYRKKVQKIVVYILILPAKCMLEKILGKSSGHEKLQPTRLDKPLAYHNE